MEKGGGSLSMAPELGGFVCLFVVLFVVFCLANILFREERVTATKETSSADGKVLLSFFRAAFIFLVNYLFINLDSGFILALRR